MQTAENSSPEYYGPTPPVSLTDGYVIGLEKLADCLSELMPLHQEQVAVTDMHMLSFPVKFNYWMYLLSEQRSQQVLFTLRKDGKVVGNLVYTIKPAANFKDAIGAVDCGLYIYPENRGGGRAVKLMRYAEEVLKELGVHYIVHGDKSLAGGADLSKFFQRQGYKPYSVEYVKEIGKVEPKS